MSLNNVYMCSEEREKNDGNVASNYYLPLSLVIILLITLLLWKRVAAIQNPINEIQSDYSQRDHNTVQVKNIPKKKLIRMKGVKNTLIAFLFYCGVEAMVGLWGASYLVGARNITAETAAGWISLYYGGITIGRLITGFVTLKINNRMLILAGQLTAITGGLILLLPFYAVQFRTSESYIEKENFERLTQDYILNHKHP